MNASHIIVLFFMLATFLVLIVGVSLMMKGGPLNAKYGNKLMVARVTLQGITILLIGIMLLTGK